MSKLLSPKQVARSIQVSESSVKRWCDKGELEVQYTAGGHRKIPISGLISFLKKTGQPIVRPELIGLPKFSEQQVTGLEKAAQSLGDALIAGEEFKARQVIMELYLSEHSLASILDQAITPAMVRIGEQWQCGEVQIYQERRSCEIILQTIQELRMLIPMPQPGSPVAIGGAISGDFYRLPTAMVEMMLRENHWNAASLGDNLPLKTLERAIQQYRPKLFWLCCSYLENSDVFLEQYRYLHEHYGLSVAFLVGGRALTPEIRAQMKYTVYCDSMQHLESFVQSFTHLTQNHISAPAALDYAETEPSIVDSREVD